MCETSNLRLFVLISSITYPTFLATSVFFQCILIVFIIFFSTPQISFLRALLIKTSIFQLLATFILFFVQPRVLVGTETDVPVYCYGLCRHFHRKVCFALYMAWQSIYFAVAISIFFTFYYKYRKLRSDGPLSRSAKFVPMCLFYIPCVISMICAVIIVLRDTFPDVAETDLEEEYYLDIGRMRLGELPNRINFVLLSMGIYCAPLIAFWLQWKTRKALKSHISEVSHLSHHRVKSLMNGLTLQMTLHFFCYFPMFTFYVYSLKTGEQFLIQQFFLALSPNLTATTDPVINLYYVVPYRNQMKKLLRKLRIGRKEQSVAGTIVVLPSASKIL